MRGSTPSALVVVSLVSVLLIAHTRAQSPAGLTVRQTAYLKASHPGAGDHFGCGGALDGHAGIGVATSGDGTTIAVGAPHESSSATGVNGNQTNDDTYSSGAVYVFTRSANG